MSFTTYYYQIKHVVSLILIVKTEIALLKQMFTFSDILDVPNALTRTLVASTVSALVEAKTEQVDNLILPLVTILAFQATCFL